VHIGFHKMVLFLNSFHLCLNLVLNLS